MDSLKLYFKYLLRKFSGSGENIPTSNKMSDIEDISILKFHQSVVSTTSTFQQLENVAKPSDECENIQTEDINSIPTNNIRNIISNCDNNSEQHLHKLNNLTKIDSNENDNKLPNLNIVIPTMDERSIVDDLSKILSPISAKNSKRFIFPQEKDFFSAKDESTKKTKIFEIITQSKQKQIRPIMGKNALLKRANIDASDSMIVHDLVLDKYNPVMNHYVNRMYQRRVSRNSTSEDESHYNETVFSSPPNYSPLSISSVYSMTFDEKTGFVFPDTQGRDSSSFFSSTERRSHSSLHRRLSMKKAFSFLGSTDDIYAESPFEDTRDTSLFSTGTGVAESSFSDYDPEKFLKNALGEVSCFSESGICSPTDEKDFNSVSHKRNSSVNTTEISSLLSKASSLYSSVKKNIKKHRPRLKSTFCESYNSPQQSSSSGNTHLDNLKKDLAVQNEIMFQISKALIYCRTSKEFNNSPQHIEAEKILLVASITKEVLINEINTIEFNNYQSTNDPRCRGEIAISNIEFSPNENYSNNNSTENQGSKIYFLVVATCGKKVMASTVVEQNEKGFLSISKCFEYRNLSADFEICICVYSMAVTEKQHSNQDHYMKCPSPKTIFHLNKASRKYKVQTDVPYIKPSAFNLQGKCYIRNPDLQKINQTDEVNLKLHDVPVYSTICSPFSVKIASNIHLDVRITGFLTIGMEHENSSTLWNRRWCVLEGAQLKYWNYPSEETSPSIGFVDLHYCAVQQIAIADRSHCARPRTLLLPIQNGGCIKKYLLSADNTIDMEVWEREINFVVRALATWNCMKCKF